MASDGCHTQPQSGHAVSATDDLPGEGGHLPCVDGGNVTSLAAPGREEKISADYWQVRRVPVTVHTIVALIIGITLRLVLFPQALLADRANAGRTDFLIFFGVAKASSNFVGGALADSWGRRPTALVGWILGVPLTAALLWTELVKSRIVLDVSDLLLGTMQGVTWGLNITLLMDILGPRGRGMASALSNAAGYFGSAVTAPVAAEMVKVTGDASMCIATLCCGVLLGFVLVATDTKVWHRVDVARELTAHVRADDNGKPPVWSIAQFLVRVGCGSSVQVFCLISGHTVNTTTAVVWGATVQWMKNEGGVSIRCIGFVEAWFTGLEVIAMLVSGFLSYRGLKPQRIAAVTMAIMAVGLGLLAWQASCAVVSWPTLLCCTGMLGVGVGGAYPALEAAVIEHVPEHQRASVYGAYRMWRDLGFASGGVFTRLFSNFASEVTGVCLWTLVVAFAFLCNAFCTARIAPVRGELDQGTEMPLLGC
ncbi:unnamed protein product [Prorocentrum cordatum]|uniref:Major facilitator superfamily (MFS) profile domain-containing protein n=1 Tax=Prorocentrum cordatum TaxID=2364126 RepID=A0ABN9UXL9_9DINO|nr:unnamed protein product [Polarella glacialis]